jgi:predicted nucleic acid-binding protein
VSVIERNAVDLKSQGTPVPDMDLLIASTALVYSLPLVTNNPRHYQNVPGPVLENRVA